MSWTLLVFLWRRHRIALICCCSIPLALGIVIGLVFPKYQEQRELVEKLLTVFSFAKRFFGSEELSMLSPQGAFCLPFQHPIALVSYAVLGAIPALSIPAGERGRGALDLLLAAPLSRARLVLTSAGFVFLIAPFIGLGGFGGALLGGSLSKVSDQLPALSYLYVACTAAALAFCLGAFALLISTASPDRGRATMIYSMAVFVFIGCDVTSRFLGDDGQWLRWFTPYGGLRPVSVVQSPPAVLWPTLSLVFVGVILSAVAAWVATLRRRA